MMEIAPTVLTGLKGIDVDSSSRKKTEIVSPSLVSIPHNSSQIDEALGVQRAIIQNQVSMQDKQMSPDVSALLDQNRTLIGQKRIKIDSKQEYDLDGFPNDILLIQKRTRKKNVLFFIPRYSIDEFYFIDKQTNKYWEIKQLIKTDSGKPTQLEHIPYFGSSAVIPTKQANIVVLNKFSDALRGSAKVQKLGITDQEKNIIDLVAPLHEMAHTLQGLHATTSEKLSSVVIKEYFARKVLLPVALWIFKHVGVGTHTEKVKKVKESVVRRERNAHAFALGTIRQLKKQGVDLLRGFGPMDTAKAIDKALLSYDMGIGIYLPGEPFSTRIKKIMRSISYK